MHKSQIVKIKKVNDNILIEKELKRLGYNPIRWAVVRVEEDKLYISFIC